MVKQVFIAIFSLVALSSCTALKQLNFTSNKQVNTVAEPPAAKSKFIEEITITPEAQIQKTESVENRDKTNPAKKTNTPVKQTVVNAHSGSLNAVPVEPQFSAMNIPGKTPVVESATSLHFKYALLMNTEVESLPSQALLEAVDDWYGVRYRLGGTTKSGVDCSAFTMSVYAAAYGMTIPRVSREQYQQARKISTTELKEGDLVFFNTRGRGVSHVGIYLGNNKFAHASVSNGVMVSDLFESYYLQRFMGAGRIEGNHTYSTN